MKNLKGMTDNNLRRGNNDNDQIGRKNNNGAIVHKI